MEEQQRLQQAIAALEAQRTLLGDAVVDASLAALRGKLAALQPALQPEAQRTQQRKQVTVLFADLTGFTALSETLDAEDVSNLINDLWRRVDRQILDHGGRIDKHIGDAVMALWGVEAAREDDPERAVRTALAIQKEVAALSEAETRPHLTLRIGIHTGLVLLGAVGSAGEFTAVGEPVTLAERLEQAAQPGSVLISQDTYHHVRGLFDFEAAPSLEIKEKREILSAYRVLRARERAFFVPRRGIEGIQTFMVGREVELHGLQEALQAAVRQNHLHKILILGEAGLGKSRLVQEFDKGLSFLPEEVLAPRARAEETRQSLSFSLARDIFAYQFDIRESDSRSEARQKLEQGIFRYLGPEAVEQAHFIGHLLGFDFSASPYLSAMLESSRDIRERGFFYSVQLLQAACRRGPVVFLLEDLHWADDASLDWLAYLQQQGEHLPVLLVGTARPSLLRRRPEWGQALELLELQPLSAEDSRRLALDILRRVRNLPSELLDQVTLQAEGNPFYLEELVKMLIESGVIARDEQEWCVDAARLGALHVPTTLTGLLQARLDRLPPQAAEVIQQAAVIGRVFWDGAVAGLSDGLAALQPSALQPSALPPAALPPEALDAALAELASRELIFPLPNSAFAGVKEYRFKHTLLREVAYERVLKARRRQFHQRAAQWLIERSGERASEFAALIADHFGRGGQPGQAADWFARAGHAARAAYALETAIGHYRQALELAGEQFSPAWRIAILEGLGEVLRFRAYFSQAEEVYQEMLAAARRNADLVGQLRALAGMHFVYDRLNQYERSLQFSQQAVELADAYPQIEPAERAWAIWGLGYSLYRLGRLDEALQMAGRSLELALQSGVQARIADNYNLLASVYHAQGHFRQAEDFMEKSLSIWRDLHHRPYEAALLGNLGENARKQGDYRAALIFFQQALEIYRQIGERDGAFTALVNLGGTLTSLGEFERAIDALNQAGEMEFGQQELNCEWYCVHALADLGLGRFPQALRMAQTALAAGEQQNNALYLGLAWRALGEVAARFGQPVLQATNPDALLVSPGECFARALEIYRQLGMPAEQGITLWRWAECAACANTPARAAELAAQARAIFIELDLPIFLQHMQQAAPPPA